ncbi:MAG: hypothetical protein B6247_01760 [Candidatus Parabeggiatoa sp. nov. 2]|nr:MAG: hypothetical protein B6247_01760 [Beggiatoa sp. 4572_84]
MDETIALAVDKYVEILKSEVESGALLSSEADTDGDGQKQNGGENTETVTPAPEEQFASLKSKYGVSDYPDESPSSPLYAILQQLEQGERLDPTDIAWLDENHIKTRWDEPKLFSGKILKAYHKIEATFYEQEYKRTGNKWDLPSASSHWRGAKKPEHALTLTAHLNLEEIKEDKLKSALLTTRGGAFRDIHDLDEAEQCARQAIEHQPDSHHPYTLMGAICYERHERSKYSEGDGWFKEAIKRGASPNDHDAEIKRVIKSADKKKRHEVAEHLLGKDPVHYEWAKEYLIDKASPKDQDAEISE